MFILDNKVGYWIENLFGKLEGQTVFAFLHCSRRLNWNEIKTSELMVLNRYWYVINYIFTIKLLCRINGLMNKRDIPWWEFGDWFSHCGLGLEYLATYISGPQLKRQVGDGAFSLLRKRKVLSLLADRQVCLIRISQSEQSSKKYKAI